MKIAQLKREDLIKATKKAFKDLGFPEKYNEVTGIDFNSRLRSSGGRVKFSATYHKEELIESTTIVEYNPSLPVEELRETAQHEAAHIITGKIDGDIVFEAFCQRYDIPLSLEEKLPSSPDNKYRVYCTDCSNEWYFKRKGKTVKMVERSPEDIHCPCGGSLKVEYLDKNKREAAIK